MSSRRTWMSAVKCRQDEEVRCPDSFDSVVDIPQNMSSTRAESCVEEVPTERSTNLQSINRRPSALKTLQSINRRPSADGSKQIELSLCQELEEKEIELSLCQELEEKEMMPDILGCRVGGGSDARPDILGCCVGGGSGARPRAVGGGSDARPDILGCCVGGGSDGPDTLGCCVGGGSDGPDILGCCAAGGSDDVVLENVSTRANRVESLIDGPQIGPLLHLFPAAGYVPGTTCEKPVASHCTCVHKKHEASSSDGSGIEHHMSPIPEGFTAEQDKAGRVESWSIIQFADISCLQSVRFSCGVRDACAEIQMDIKETPIRNVYLNCAFPDGIEASLRDEYKFINTRIPRGKRLGFFIIILPEVRDFDDKVEAVCKDLGVVYHCCFPQDVKKLNKQYLNNIAREIYVKVLKRNSSCDFCKNIGLDGSSMEFCVLDEEFDDSDYDEDMSLSTESDDGSENGFLMEGDDGSDEGAFVEQKAEVTLDIPDTIVMNGNSAEYHTLEEIGDPLPESCSERTDLRLVEVEQAITKDWACISYSRICHDDLFRFFSKLHASMGNGMQFNSMPIKMEMVRCATAGIVSQTWSDLRHRTLELFPRLRQMEIAFLIVILPESRDFDEEIEKFFNDIGVVHQFCLPLTVRISSSRHLKKLARQIKFKISKRGMVIPFMSEEPTIVLGADIAHYTPEEDEGSSSVVSVVASLDWPKISKYAALVTRQPRREVIITDIIWNHLLNFQFSTGELPQRMIFFRHGINEGQQYHICQEELDAIRLDCRRLKYQPKLTYVVVTQRLKMEFEGSSSNMTKKRLRVQQDTSYPTKFEVLCDHGPFEGTKMVVHYRVVHDENNLTAQELESIIIRLSLARDCQVFPEISMIPPAHFACLAAHYYERQLEAHDSRKSEGSYDAAIPSFGGLFIKPYQPYQMAVVSGAAATTNFSRVDLS